VSSFRRAFDPNYKANRTSIAQRRQRHRELVWATIDPPATWLLPLSKELQALELRPAVPLSQHLPVASPS
jgi:hypothetical protein